MKRFQKVWSILLVLALTVTALTAYSALFSVPVSADAATDDGFSRHIALNVADGPIKIYTDRYVQNEVVHEGFPCDTTLYTITGAVNYADTVIRLVQDEVDPYPVATFHVVFRDLTIHPNTWCSVVHFKTLQPAPEEGEPMPMTVDLRLEGRNYIAGYNHPGIRGNAVANIEAAPDSYSVFTSEYSGSEFSLDSDLTMNKIGDYEIKVNGASADLDAGKTARPAELIGPDSATLVQAKIDALPPVSEVGMSDKDAIVAARAAYAALTAEKRETVDADVLQHLTDDEAAIAEQEAALAAAAAEETESDPAPKRKRDLTALWVVLGFLGGAGCAVGTLFLIEKKRKPAREPEADLPEMNGEDASDADRTKP